MVYYDVSSCDFEYTSNIYITPTLQPSGYPQSVVTQFRSRLQPRFSSTGGDLSRGIELTAMAYRGPMQEEPTFVDVSENPQISFFFFFFASQSTPAATLKIKFVAVSTIILSEDSICSSVVSLSVPCDWLNAECIQVHRIVPLVSYSYSSSTRIEDHIM